jgi:16S rRNA (adenine1518-N6/adenine1519-N6)-dimethyltransferase
LSRPKKSLGQNFLVDRNLQRRIVDALGAGPDDEVLEIGPGRGALTAHLVGRVRRLVLVELDDDLVEALQVAYGERPDVEVVHADVLSVRTEGLSASPAALRVVGNIPYNITTPILFHLLRRPRPAVILLMIQKEVAERLTAAPGTSEYGALSVGVRTVATVERVVNVPRGAFRPVPRVDSAVVRITPLDPPPLDETEEVRLRTLTRAAFQWRRKQLQKILRDHPDLLLPEARLPALEAEAGYSFTARPETLSPEGFVRLSRLVAR